jgi:hypothetical protein
MFARPKKLAMSWVGNLRLHLVIGDSSWVIGELKLGGKNCEQKSAQNFAAVVNRLKMS